MKDQRAVKGPIFSRTSLQTPSKVLNFQGLDANLRARMKDKNALVVRRETFTRGETPSLWLVGMTFLERMDQRADPLRGEK